MKRLDGSQGRSLYLIILSIISSLFLSYPTHSEAFQPSFPTQGTITPVEQLAVIQASPKVIMDRFGTAYAVWSDNRNRYGDIYFSHRPKGGDWQPNVRINDDPGLAAQYSPAIAVDDLGTVYAVWTDERNGDADIYFSHRPKGGSWQPNVKLNDDSGPAEQRNPTIASTGYGDLFIAWQDLREGNPDIYFTLRPYSGSWQANVKVNDDWIHGITAWQERPAIAVDRQRNAYLVWQDSRYYDMLNPDIMFSYRPWGGSWGENVPVNDDYNASANEHFGPSIAVDVNGTACAAWEDHRNGVNVYAAYRPAGTDWGENQRVNDADAQPYHISGVSIAPAMLFDMPTFFVVWADDRSGDYDLYGSMLFFVWLPDGKTGDGSTAHQVRPSVAVDPDWNYTVVWQEGKAFDIHASYYPQAQPGWEPDLQVNDDGSGEAIQKRPSVAMDATGKAYALWLDYRDETDIGRIVFSERPRMGSWSAGVTIYEGGWDMVNAYPQVAANPGGDVCAVWNERRAGNYGVYATCRPAGGAWETEARVNNDSGLNEKYEPRMAVDSAGNAYAVWTDNRLGNLDIFFSFRPRGGAWQPDMKVNDDSGTALQHSPSLGVDSDGRVYVVWKDKRLGNYDIFFSLRSPDGIWTSNVKVNDDSGATEHSAPDIYVDPTGNARAAWKDGRNGTSDIYFSQKPAGQDWGGNEKVNDDEGETGKYAPRIAADPAGNAYVLWSGNRYSLATIDNIYFSWRPPGGVWNPVSVVRENKNFPWEYDLAADGRRVFMVWTGRDYGNDAIFYALSNLEIYLPLIRRDTPFPGNP